MRVPFSPHPIQYLFYRYFTSLVKFIPRYLFFVVVTIVNGIGFLVSLPDSSLLMYKNSIDFWVLISYPTLQSSFIRSSSFGGVCRVFYVQQHVICEQ